MESLTRLRTLVKVITAKAGLISTNCMSVYPAALMAENSSSLA